MTEREESAARDESVRDDEWEVRGGTEECDETAEPSPAAVFELLGDETRLEIVRALARLSSEQWVLDSVGYSDLREAVGVEDGGRFNYHLQKLRGAIVRKHGEEYCLTGSGYRVARVLRSGRLERGPSVAGQSGASCPQCDRPTEVRFADGVCSMHCPEHGQLWDMILPPAAGRHYDPQTLASLAALHAGWYVELARLGTCYECWDEVATSVVDSRSAVDGYDGPVVAVHCERCALTYWLPPQAFLRRHPAVTAFLWDHGVDVRWDDPAAVSRIVYAAVTGVERTDDGLRVSLEADGESLAIEFDEDASVRGTERSTAGVDASAGEQ